MVKYDKVYLYLYLIEEYAYKSKIMHTNYNHKFYLEGRKAQGVAGIANLQIKYISAVRCSKNQNDNDNDKSMLGMRKSNKKDEDYNEKSDKATFSSFVGSTIVSLLFSLGIMAFISFLNNRYVLSVEQNGGTYKFLGDIQIV